MKLKLALLLYPLASPLPPPPATSPFRKRYRGGMWARKPAAAGRGREGKRKHRSPRHSVPVRPHTAPAGSDLGSCPCPSPALPHSRLEFGILFSFHSLQAELISHIADANLPPACFPELQTFVPRHCISLSSRQTHSPNRTLITPQVPQLEI